MKSQKQVLDEPALHREYERGVAGLQELEQEAVFILDRALTAKDLRIHSLTHRVKKFQSFLEKCKRMEFQNPLKDMQDVVGLRVVCLYLSDIQRVLDLVKEVFDFVREADSVNATDMSSFGYMSHHVVVQMKSTYKGPRYDALLSKPFEVQIRTILMDAWANVSHHLLYKSENDVPRNLLRDFHALSGLFYVADTHFEMFFAATQKSREKMAELFKRSEPQSIEEEINLDSLQAYLGKKFPARQQPTSGQLSQLVSELKNVGYSRIAEIDEVYEQTRSLVAENERKTKPSGNYYRADGLIRVAFLIASENYCTTVAHSWQMDDKQTQETLQSYAEYRKRIVSPATKGE